MLCTRYHYTSDVVIKSFKASCVDYLLVLGESNLSSNESENSEDYHKAKKYSRSDT